MQQANEVYLDLTNVTLFEVELDNSNYYLLYFLVQNLGGASLFHVNIAFKEDLISRN